MRLSWLWPVINLITTLIASVIVFVVPMTPFQSYVTPSQPFIVMGFLLFCPGMALVRFLRLNDLAIELSLAVALSLSVDSIVAGAFLYAKYWSLLDMMAVLVLLTLTCSIAQIVMQLPLVGLARSQEQTDDIEKTATVSLASVRGATQKPQEVMRESTPQPVEMAASRVRKDAWDLEKAATTIMPAVAHPQSLQRIEKVSTTIMPAASDSQKASSQTKDIEKAATTIMPAASDSRKKDIEKTATTIMPAMVQSQNGQSIAEKDTKLLTTTSNPSGTQKIEEKDTTHMPLAAGAGVVVQNKPATQEEKKKALFTPPIDKPQDTPAIEEKQAPLVASTARSTDALEDEEADNTDKMPVVRRKKLQKDTSNNERDTDANLKSEDFSTPIPGETPNPLPALPPSTVTKNVLRKRRLLNQ
ncbi:MAG TPA: hypothetical protein VFU49_03460 [Ktedonobacteraceae bacterium]|nr:hypothetical protein [Ktedonobacteraceae bacterium]